MKTSVSNLEDAMTCIALENTSYTPEYILENILYISMHENLTTVDKTWNRFKTDVAMVHMELCREHTLISVDI